MRRPATVTIPVLALVGVVLGLGGHTFVYAKGHGFHGSQGAVRILGEAIDHLLQGQVALRPLPSRAARRAADGEARGGAPA